MASRDDNERGRYGRWDTGAHQPAQGREQAQGGWADAQGRHQRPGEFNSPQGGYGGYGGGHESHSDGRGAGGSDVGGRPHPQQRGGEYGYGGEFGGDAGGEFAGRGAPPDRYSGFNEQGSPWGHQHSGGWGGGFGHRQPEQGRGGQQGHGQQRYGQQGYGPGDGQQGYGGQQGGYGGGFGGAPQPFAGGQDAGGDRGHGAQLAHDRGGHGQSHGFGGPGMPQHHHDHDYHQWREEQLRNLDNDYHSWRQERYKKFSDEFNQWRSSRGVGRQSGNEHSSTGGNFGPTGGPGADAARAGQHAPGTPEGGDFGSTGTSGSTSLSGPGATSPAGKTK